MSLPASTSLPLTGQEEAARGAEESEQRGAARLERAQGADFELRFRNINYMQGGLMMISDAALGNVDEQGRISGTPDEKVHSQSCYIVMLVDDELLAGRSGRFSTVDFRSHRIPRVCRSSYAAETLGCEEGFDAAELLRGFFAEARGLPVHGKDAYLQVTRIPLVGVTDARTLTIGSPLTLDLEVRRV